MLILLSDSDIEPALAWEIDLFLDFASPTARRMAISRARRQAADPHVATVLARLRDHLRWQAIAA